MFRSSNRHHWLALSVVTSSLFLTGCAFATVMPQAWPAMFMSVLLFIVAACDYDPEGLPIKRPERPNTEPETCERAATASLEAGDLDPCDGFLVTIPVDPDDSRAGASVSRAGDIDGDGLGDLVIGAPGASLEYGGSGKTFFIFGLQPAPETDRNINLDDLDENAGFVIEGYDSYDYDYGSGYFGPYSLEDYDQDNNFGFRVAGGFDLNGDGFADASASAPGTYWRDEDYAYASGSYDYRGYNYGRVAILTGTDEGFDPVISSLDDLANGNGGTVIEGTYIGSGEGNYYGSGAGRGITLVQDLNGDGLADLIIGEPYYGYGYGRVTVFFGNTEGHLPAGGLAGNTDNAYMWLTPGEGDGYIYLGQNLADAGDVTGDGRSDFLVSTTSGEGGTVLLVDAGQLNGQYYIYDYYQTRFTVSSGGSITDAFDGNFDFNGDGRSDVVIGNRNDNGGNGRVWVIFGSEGGTMDLNGSEGYTEALIINGESEGNGIGDSVAGAGDFNGDGFDDIIIGARDTNNDTGAAYIVFGKADWSADNVLVPSELDGENGLAINGINEYDGFGSSVAGAGDVNGDGFSDVIVGFPGSGIGYSGTSKSGAAVIFGRATEGTELVGTSGNDVLDGDTFNAVIGGAGHDVLRARTDAIRIDGGSGYDVWQVITGSEGETIDFSEGAMHVGVKIRDIEAIDLRGDGDIYMDITSDDISLLSSTSTALAIIGDGYDTLYVDECEGANFYYDEGGPFSIDIGGETFNAARYTTEGYHTLYIVDTESFDVYIGCD